MKILKIYRESNWYELKRKFDSHFGFGALERILFSNWFNPLATFWLNFRSLSIFQAIKFPIWVYGRPRFYNLSGRIIIKGKVKCGMIKFNQVRPGSPNLQSVQSELMNQGTIIFNGSGIIGTGNNIRVASTGVLDIGNNFKIADMCNIGCYERITIGELSRIVHRCQIMDSNYHYVANFNKRVVPKWHNPIVIGRGCWICNSSTVTGGSVLPDFTIVASNSLVNKNYSHIESNSIIGGIPAKFIASGFRRVENSKLEHKINHYYQGNPDGIYEIPDEVTIDDCSNNNL